MPGALQEGRSSLHHVWRTTNALFSGKTAVPGRKILGLFNYLLNLGYLRLEDDKGKVLAQNDDISYPDNLNSRIIFTAQQDGSYRIVATSFQQRGTGNYTIPIRAFTPKK